MTVLGALWFAWLLLLGIGHRPAPPRARALVAAPATGCGHGSRRSLARQPARAVAAVRAALGRPPDARSDQRIVLAVAGGVAAVVVAGPPGVLVGAGVWLAAVVRDRGRNRRRPDRWRPELIVTCELLVLALDAGLPLLDALDAVSRRLGGPAARALRDCVGDGLDVADRLEALGRREPVSRPLVAVLVDGVRYGAPVRAACVAAANDLRTAHRRSMDAAVRSVPVKLLFPLALFVLPAFVVLTVGPVALSALDGLVR
ncbi:MAG: type II secretion system F family protein [Actinomycetota bacterium]|nr:type II secretion system F family protein [Actinomycetota bacterium]